MVGTIKQINCKHDKDGAEFDSLSLGYFSKCSKCGLVFDEEARE